MKSSEMRELGATQFASEIESRKKELMELRFQAAMGNLEKPHRVTQLRREVAQLNTIRHQQASSGAAKSGQGEQA